MKFLLDTAAVSETRKPKPNPGYLGWLRQQHSDEAFIGTPTLGELFAGIAPLRAPAERERLLKWTLEILRTFEQHIVPLDAEAAQVWGEAMGDARRRGRILSVIDAQLAAIAFVNGFAVVTRNVRHFAVPEFEGLKVISPWS